MPKTCRNFLKNIDISQTPSKLLQNIFWMPQTHSKTRNCFILQKIVFLGFLQSLVCTILGYFCASCMQNPTENAQDVPKFFEKISEFLKHLPNSPETHFQYPSTPPGVHNDVSVKFHLSDLRKGYTLIHCRFK